MADRIAELEARRAKRRADHEKAFAEQQLVDLEALDLLEEEHGWARVLRIDLEGWRAGSGSTTMVVCRVPVGSDVVVKKFMQQVHAKDAKPAQVVAAEEELGNATIVYPEKGSDAYVATVEMAPAVLGHVAAQVVKVVQGRAAEEGK